MTRYKFKINYLIVGVVLMLQSCLKDEASKPVTPINKNLISFDFKTLQNGALLQNISGEFVGDTIFVATFSGTNLTNLVPSFFGEGVELSVAGKPQTSNQTPQNFTSPVEYTAKASDGSTRKYVVKFTDTNVPVLYISTNNRPITSKTTYVTGSLKIKKNITGDSLYSGEIEIRGRGNSTWNFPKKPYKIKLGKKAGLLGMNESKQWVLLANYADKTLIRNELGFELSRRFGLAYTSAGRFVEVVLNNVYLGNYELVEQIDVGKNKVNITEQSVPSTNITGGYMVELDGFANTEPVNFTTPRNMPISVHYPDDDDIVEAQREYIKNYLVDFENRLFFNDFDDSTSYKKVFDVDSYVNYYLVNEIMGNSDIFWSTNMYKNQKNAFLFTGPVWDFDIAANNDQRLGNAVNKLMLTAAHNPKQWINRLMQDKFFRSKVRKRWNEMYGKVSLGIFIDELVKKLAISQKKNFAQWPILNEKVHLNFQVAGSYEGEVNYLKNYLSNRILWLNTQFNGSLFD